MATSTSSSTSTVATDRLLASATQLALLLPHMDRSDVLYAVGFSSDNADQGEVKKRLRHLVRAHCVQRGMPVFGTDEKAKEERAFKVFNLMQRNPEKSNHAPGKTIKLTEAMMFTGFSSAKAKSADQMNISASTGISRINVVQNHRLLQSSTHSVFPLSQDLDEKIQIIETPLC